MERRRRGRQCYQDDPEDCERQCIYRHAGSCHALATIYLLGKGRPVVWGRSAIFFEQACQLGGASACNTLGMLHAYGLGVDEDRSRARSLFEISCDAGNRTGCKHLAVLLRDERRPAPYARFLR